ncbi:hypothetical protein HPP92_004227 [Vanilla planifolia]|uniref:Uncharacterized protein n=1 Tax=Vanilla planifolia TaxID=51239 RepID=A0A835RWB5_VANPL|nr:hypothetical protein HPP92_004681 [Vanilla planifolia]KAG0493233.1 hypothetical protein HPP92_004227 [Vanilla planifolia]
MMDRTLWYPLDKLNAVVPSNQTKLCTLALVAFDDKVSMYFPSPTSAFSSRPHFPSAKKIPSSSSGGLNPSSSPESSYGSTASAIGSMVTSPHRSSRSRFLDHRFKTFFNHGDHGSLPGLRSALFLNLGFISLITPAYCRASEYKGQRLPLRSIPSLP